MIFEVVEYTFSDSYFDSAAMKQLELNPTFDTVKDEACVCDLRVIEHLLVK